MKYVKFILASIFVNSVLTLMALGLSYEEGKEINFFDVISVFFAITLLLIGIILFCISLNYIMETITRNK